MRRAVRPVGVLDASPQVLPVRSLPVALAFYRDGLGFALVHRTPRSAVLQSDAADDRLELRVASGRGAACLVVEDLAAAGGAVLRHGGEVSSPRLRIEPDRHLLCTDPDGNALDLIQRAAAGGSS